MPQSGDVFITPTTRDVLGRYVCNTFEEARATWENGPGFDAIVIGGGTFGAILAADLYFRSEPFMRGDPFAPMADREGLVSGSDWHGTPREDA